MILNCVSLLIVMTALVVEIRRRAYLLFMTASLVDQTLLLSDGVLRARWKSSFRHGI